MFYRIIAASAIALMPVAGGAQAPVRPDPTDPAAPVARLSYESPFSGYQRQEDPTPSRWKDVNKEVESLGGHMGHVRGARSAAPQRPAPAPDVGQPSGHKGQK